MLPHIIWLGLIYFKYVSANWMDYSLLYFSQKEVNTFTGIFCNEDDASSFIKLFSRRGFGVNTILQSNREFLQTWPESILSKTGVVLDGSCNFTQSLLELASKNRLLDITRHWLIYMDKHYSLEELEHAAEEWKPDSLNIREFLDNGNEEMKHGELMAKYNAEANADILRELIHQTVRNKSHTPDQKIEDAVLHTLVKLDARVDSEVTLAVPGNEGESYELYEVFRLTIFTKLQITRIGSMGGGNLALTKGNLTFSSTTYRTNYNGTFLRAMCSLLVPGYYSTNGELTLQEHDRWALTSLQQFVVLQEMLNFRAVIKCIDNYGWSNNGIFTGLTKIMHERKTDVMAQSWLMTQARFPVSDYVAALFDVRLGIIFREPSLPSVTNIFILPFSNDVWLSILALLLFCTILLYGQLKSTKNMDNLQCWDILMYFTGAACQQGTEIPVRTISVRVTMAVFLIASLFFYTSYSATIVALLQSPSDFIRTVNDIADSSFDVGVQNQPYQRNMLRDDNSSIMTKLKIVKLSPQGEKAFISAEEGIGKVQAGMFAFQCDLMDAYRAINRQFNDKEKCDLKAIPDFKGSFSGPAVPKKSPYREIQKQKYLALREFGFNSRAYSRWTPKEPVCENKGGRFDSVGLIDVSPVFLFLVYGIGLSLIILAAEKMIYRCRISDVSMCKLKAKVFVRNFNGEVYREAPVD